MKRHLIGAAVMLMILCEVSFVGSEMLSNDLADLYNNAKEVLGSKEKTIIANGYLRVIVWRSQVTQELMIMSITGLRANPEYVMSSFPAYSLSQNGIFSTRMYQCSWREVRAKIFYECGEAMKLPDGVRETVPEQMARDFQTVINAAARLNREIPLARSQE